MKPKRKTIVALIVFNLLMVYGFSGFILAPYLLNKYGTTFLQKNYGVDTTVEDISINPFTFSISLQNLQMRHKTEPLLSVNSFTLNIDPLHLLMQDLSIKTVFVDTLQTHLTIEKDGSLNLLNIFTNNTQKKDTQNTASFPFTISLQSFTLQNSSLTLHNQKAATPYTVAIGPLSHTFKDLSTQLGSDSMHRSQFDFRDLGLATVDANVGLKPFFVNAKILHNGLQLPSLNDFTVPFDIDFDAGSLAYEMEFSLTQSQGLQFDLSRFVASLSSLHANYAKNPLARLQEGIIEVKDLNVLLDDKQIPYSAQFANITLNEASFFDSFVADTMHNFARLSLELNDLSSTDDFGYKLFVDQNKDANLRAKGTLNLQNKKTDTLLQLQNIALKPYNPYLKTRGFALDGSLSDLTGHLMLRWDQTLDLNTSTSATFDNLQLFELKQDSGALFDMQALEIALKNLRIHSDSNTTDVKAHTVDANASGVQVHENRIENQTFAFEKMQLHADDFALDQNFWHTLSLWMPNKQQLEISGDANLQQKAFTHDITIQNLLLAPFNPYLDNYVNIALQNGKANLKLLVNTQLQDKKIGLNTLLSGDFSDIEVVNKQDQKLVDIKTITLQDIDYELSKNSFSAQLIALDGIDAVFDNTGEQTNFANLIVESKGTQGTKESSQPMQLAIENITLANSAVTLHDKNSFTLTDITLRATPIKTGARSDITLSSALDNGARLHVDGKVDPYDFKKYTQLEAKLEGLDLRTLSIYAADAIGRQIHGGRLSNTIDAKIQNSVLDSNHQVHIHNLEVSDHLSDSNASRLPINLAIALLQDRDKQIALDIDIDNDINDPDFKVSNIILSVLKNVIVKTASSPFSLLGSLVGLSQDELSHATFEKGQTTLGAKELITLDAIKKILTQRPELSLRICSSYDLQKDTQALKEQKLQQLLQDASLQKIAASLQIQSTQQLRQEVLDALTISDEQLQAVAKGRSDYIYTYLLQSGIDADRLQRCKEVANDATAVTFTIDTQ